MDQRNRADEARKRLGVDQVALAACRKITPLLSESGLTRERVIQILESDDAEDSRRFLVVFRGIPESDVCYLTLEEICLAAGLTTRRLWEVIQGARMEQSHDSVKMMLSENRSKVMAMAIKAATSETPIIGVDGEVVGWNYGDLKATELLWKADGTLATPKGMSIYVNQQNNSSSSNDVDELPLAGMDETLKEIQRITTAPQPQLEAPKITVPIIDVEYEEVPIGVRE